MTTNFPFLTKADNSAILTNVFFGQLCPSIALQEEDGFVFEIKGWDQWRYDLSLFVVDKQLPNILIVYKLIKGKSALKEKWRQYNKWYIY